MLTTPAFHLRGRFPGVVLFRHSCQKEKAIMQIAVDQTLSVFDKLDSNPAKSWDASIPGAPKSIGENTDPYVLTLSVSAAFNIDREKLGGEVVTYSGYAGVSRTSATGAATLASLAFDRFDTGETAEHAAAVTVKSGWAAVIRPGAQRPPQSIRARKSSTSSGFGSNGSNVTSLIAVDPGATLTNGYDVVWVLGLASGETLSFESYGVSGASASVILGNGQYAVFNRATNTWTSPAAFIQVAQFPSNLTFAGLAAKAVYDASLAATGMGIKFFAE
jgi:hypothetical protein